MNATETGKTAPVSSYPRKDANHAVTYWTGPVGAPGTYVTGWRKYDGARSTYYRVTCTCTPLNMGVTKEFVAPGFQEAKDRLEQIAYDHAASHVLNGHKVTR